MLLDANVQILYDLHWQDWLLLLLKIECLGCREWDRLGDRVVLHA